MNLTVINTLFAPYQVGGAERSVEEIVTFLSKDHDVRLLTLRDRVDQSIPDREVRRGIEVVRFTLRFRYWPFPKRERPLINRFIWHFLDLFSFALFWRVLLDLLRNRPAVVMTHNLTGLSMGPWFAAKILRVPVVHVLHDYNLMCPNTTMRRDFKNCVEICIQCKLRKNLTNLSPKPAALVGVSEFTLNQHRKFLTFPESTLFGVAHGSASFVPKDRNKIVYDFGFLGGLNEVKGIEVFVSAAKKMPENTFAVAGKPSDAFIESIEGFPNIKFLGWCDAVEFYSLVDVLIVPSVWNDPAPRVILEAKRAGMHVVISNLPTLVEIAKYNDCSYSVFEPGNSEALVEVLNSLTKKLEKISSNKFMPSQGEQLLKFILEVLSIRDRH